MHSGRFSNTFFCKNIDIGKTSNVHGLKWATNDITFAFEGHTVAAYGSKVRIFWEGHKILWMLLRRFDWHYIGQIYGGDFAKFCGLLKVSELYLRYTVRIPIAIPGQIGLLMGPSRFSWYLLLLLLNLHLYLSMSDGNMLSVDRVFLGSLNQSWLGKIAQG